MRSAVSPFRRFLGYVADAIWPSACILCGSDERLVDREVCEDCLGKILHAEPRLTLPPLKSIDVLFLYDDVTRALVHRFKFGGKPQLASTLAELMVRHLERLGRLPEDVLLVPIPDHPTRRRERGYNPAELLTDEFAKRLNLPLERNLLQRIHYGPHQSILTDDERRRMHRNTFGAKAPVPGEEGRMLLLVDDVMHTGTTLKRAASSLQHVGWNDISALVLCG